MPALPVSPGTGPHSCELQGCGVGGLRSCSGAELVWVESPVLPSSHRAAGAAEPYAVQGPGGADLCSTEPRTAPCSVSHRAGVAPCSVQYALQSRATSYSVQDYRRCSPVSL